MPDIIVHDAFGAEVLERTGLKVKKEIYAFGLLGPDPFLFYHFYLPPFRHNTNRYSSVMHREHTGDFLMELLKRAKGNDEMFSYLAGFLCHYALDANTHPYIIRKARHDPLMHMAIEHKLDKLNGGRIRVPAFLPESMKDGFSGAVREVYGWDDAWEKLKAGHRDMKPFFRIVEDRSGRLDAFARMTHTRLSLVSYRSRAIEDMDLRRFSLLYRRALDDAVRYIEAARAYLDGGIKEETVREIIGSRSYIDG